MTALANFASTPRVAQAQISTANTARDGTGTLATVLTAGASGSRIDDIAMVAAGTVTAGVVRLFVHDGTTARLWQEILVTATTPSTTVAVWSAALRDQALILQSGWSLRAATNNAEAINVIVTRAGDF